jgi:glycerol kinase
MSVILAIDQSTSATKALLFDDRGGLIDRTSLEHAQHYPQPGWVEHDAEEIYQNSVEAIRTLLTRHADLQNDLLCLSITNQRETVVVFERGTGKPLHHAIVWQCRRGEPICDRLVKAGHSDIVRQKTGLRIDTYFPASKITWLLENKPDIKRKLETGEALIGTIDTYLIYRLTNSTVFATDQTNASRTLLFDIGTLEWDEELCALFGVPRRALADVQDSSGHFGETTVEGILSKAIPICGVIGDSQAALFAEHCFKPGMAKVTFGTGSSVLLNIGDQVRLSGTGGVTTIGWRVNGATVYAFEGIINFTGGTIAWLRDQLQLISDPRETEALAKSIDDNGGVYLVPAFVGLSAPYWKPNAKAAIVGLTPSATRAHVVRAALESIAYQVKDVLDLMCAEAGLAMQQVHGDGGMVSNQFLMQYVADVTGLTVRASTLPDLSPLGAVLAGLLGLKRYHSLDDLDALPHTFTNYVPQTDSEHAASAYAGWLSAVKQVMI